MVIRSSRSGMSSAAANAGERKGALEPNAPCSSSAITPGRLGDKEDFAGARVAHLLTGGEITHIHHVFRLGFHARGINKAGATRNHLAIGGRTTRTSPRLRSGSGTGRRGHGRRRRSRRCVRSAGWGHVRGRRHRGLCGLHVGVRRLHRGRRCTRLGHRTSLVASLPEGASSSEYPLFRWRMVCCELVVSQLASTKQRPR